MARGLNPKVGYKRVGDGSMWKPSIRVPETIKFMSDDSIVRFDKFLPKTEHRKQNWYVFIYFQASERSGKLGTELPLTEERLIELINARYTVVTYAKDDSSGKGK
jgi:hypothetical protein